MRLPGGRTIPVRPFRARQFVVHLQFAARLGFLFLQELFQRDAPSEPELPSSHQDMDHGEFSRLRIDPPRVPAQADPRRSNATSASSMSASA